MSQPLLEVGAPFLDGSVKKVIHRTTVFVGLKLMDVESLKTQAVNASCCVAASISNVHELATIIASEDDLATIVKLDGLKTLAVYNALFWKINRGHFFKGEY